MNCEHCLEPYDVSYGSGRFCSAKCARAFSYKNVGKNKKQLKCLSCETIVEVDSRVSKVKCDSCKSKSKACKMCGIDRKVCKSKDTSFICKKAQLLPTLNKLFGFDLSTKGSTKLFEEFYRVKNIIEEDYYDNNLSIHMLMDKYNYTQNNPMNFSKIMNALGISRRSISDANKVAIIENRTTLPSGNRYKSGYHNTWNGKTIFYRSSYELDYAKELDKSKTDYEVEDLRILYWDSQHDKQRIAIPDFYIPSTNTIVEIKSDWTYDEQNMIDKVKSYRKHGYSFKLILEHKEKEI